MKDMTLDNLLEWLMMWIDQIGSDNKRFFAGWTAYCRKKINERYKHYLDEWYKGVK